MNRDVDAVKISYPFIVKRHTKYLLDEEIGRWLLELGDGWIIINREIAGESFVITYGFKREDNAVVFSLKFNK